MAVRKPLHTNIDAELLKMLKLKAVENEKGINEMLEEILRDYFQKKRILY